MQILKSKLIIITTILGASYNIKELYTNSCEDWRKCTVSQM